MKMADLTDKTLLNNKRLKQESDGHNKISESITDPKVADVTAETSPNRN